MAAASTDIELSHISVQETDNAENHKTRRPGGGKTQLMFRFLKLTFKNEKLEELYKRSVYREYQYLLLIVCILMALLAVIGLIVTASTGKVCSSHQLTACSLSLLPQLNVLPLASEQELTECISTANLTFAWVSSSSVSSLISSSLSRTPPM